MSVLHIPTRIKAVSEADVRKLHDKLEWARRTFRPEEGFLSDRVQDRLPSDSGARYVRSPGMNTRKTR